MATAQKRSTPDPPRGLVSPPMKLHSDTHKPAASFYFSYLVAGVYDRQIDLVSQAAVSRLGPDLGMPHLLRETGLSTGY
jgi:hypothetical protein